MNVKGKVRVRVQLHLIIKYSLYRLVEDEL